MKKTVYAMLAILTLCLNSCYEEKMEWSDPYEHPAAADLPLALQEKISRYEALNAYANFKIGAGIDFTLYQTDETYRNIINENFDEVTAGNEMKQSSLLNSKGELSFTSVDAAIAQLKAAGLTIYGHTLVWHNQQQASYINSLLQPVVVPGTPGSSLIANGDFESGLDGWDIPYYKEAVTQSTDYSIDGTHSMKIAVGDWGGSKYNMQINSPKFQIINGHKYEISFFIRSDIPGSVGIDFPNDNLTNQYPWTNGSELAATGSAWTKVVYNPTTTPDGMVATADNSAMTFRLLLGSTKDCTYYIDGVEVIDLDAAPAEVNYVPNGDFETGDMTGWVSKNPGAGISVAAEAAYAGSFGIKGTASASSANEWDLQFATNEITLDASKTYTVSFMIKSDMAGQGRISYSGFSNNYPWTNWDGSGTKALFDTGTSWKEITYTLSNDWSGAAKVTLNFDLGKVPNATYYVDNVKIIEQTSAAPALRAAYAGPTEIPQTMEEKARKVDSVLYAYIIGVTAHFKGSVAAWDVVNEPLNDNGTVREGLEDLSATSVFYWQYYLGKDYAAKAFKYAKEGDATAKLFINDYGLESASGNKVDGLIEYVKYIESQGAQVDGIGTQLHLNINWSDTTAIDRMFQKLAATGKLIKVSELDVAISSESSPASPVAPTAEQYAQQAELYRFVANSFIKNVPEAQRYGITVWGISDNEQEHVYWLTNDAPNLWDANYARKHAYKGFCDGLAGRDVSADFSGELQY